MHCAVWGVALALACPCASAQTRFGLSADAHATYQRWVLGTCITGEERALRDALSQRAGTLAPAFRLAIIEGPSAEETAAVRAAAAQAYTRRANFPLAQFRITGVGRDDIARFRSVSQQAYVDDQVARFIMGYRSNAVAALAITGDPDSRALLGRIAENARDPLAPAARAALQSLREPR